MIVGKNVFDQLVKSNMRTYENIQETAAVQGDGDTASCLLEYTYLKKYHTMNQNIKAN